MHACIQRRRQLGGLAAAAAVNFSRSCCHPRHLLQLPQLQPMCFRHSEREGRLAVLVSQLASAIPSPTQ
jgi:hypothetical protein